MSDGFPVYIFKLFITFIYLFIEGVTQHSIPREVRKQLWSQFSPSNRGALGIKLRLSDFPAKPSCPPQGTLNDAAKLVLNRIISPFILTTGPHMHHTRLVEGASGWLWLLVSINQSKRSALSTSHPHTRSSPWSPGNTHLKEMLGPETSPKAGGESYLQL